MKIKMTKCKPDRPGVWLYGNQEDAYRNAVCVRDPSIHSPHEYYAFVMDLPEVEPPIKYREPTAIDALGNPMVEVRVNEFTPPLKRKLMAVVARPGNDHLFIAEDEDGVWSRWRFARMIDDGTRPIERWSVVEGTSVFSIHEQRQQAEHAKRPGQRVVRMIELPEGM